MGHGADLVASRDEQSRFAVSAPSWRHVKELLYEATALAPASRAKFLDEVCASDAALRAELEALLAVNDGLSTEFLQSPATGGFAADGGELGAVGLAAGQLFARRFQLIRRLGEGGMGQVWLAEQTEPVRRPVALKLIKAGMYDETVVQRFQAERQSLAIMDHPAIAKVFDAGITPQGQPYFVMEYVPGLAITEYCDQKKLKIRERLELFIHACEGVQHAHQKAIIHRDLKPANILVIEVDGNPVPRIIDFGLAKSTGTHLADETLHTRFGQFLGTPGYMSPEQVDPNVRDVDTRTDVYSLGVILYVLLTGMQPFEMKGRQRPSLEEWLRQLREEEPRRPSSKVSADRETSALSAAARSTEQEQLVSLLRGDLDWIAMKALERDRERRYGTPAELAADLRRCLNDEPVVARPASFAYQLGKLIRRHRIATVVAAMMTALAVAASGAGLIAVRKEREARFQATQALQAQSRLLVQTAAQRLRDSDEGGAQGIILEVLTNPAFTELRTPAAISVFQDIRAADLQLAVLSGHGDAVISAAYSPDGAHIVTASLDHTARVWDAHTGVQLEVLTGHGDRVGCAAYSPDGAHIVTASNDKTARIWDARTGAKLLVLAGHLEELNSAAYSPDGMRIVTAAADKTARIWDATTGAQLAVLTGHADIVDSAAYSPDGTRIVTASEDKTARIWDAHTGRTLLVLSGHGNRVNSAAYSPDGTRIVTASFDNTARIWDARTGAQLAVLSGGGGVYSAAYSHDGARIVTALFDNTARIWDARSGAPLAVLSGHARYLISAAYSPDDTRIVTASFDTTARIWNARTSAQLAALTGHGAFVNAAAYSPDGTRIVTASADRTARIWDALTGKQLAVLAGHGQVLYTAAYSPDGTRIVTAAADRTARIWEARAGTQIAALTARAVVYSAAYSPDSTRIVTALEDKTAQVWDARRLAPLATLSGHGGYVYSALYSPDGARIVTASRDKTARIWDARTGAQLSVLAGHRDFVEFAVYSPDGTRIVTTSGDKTARIWDARTGAPLAVLSGHGDWVVGAAYSPDGTRIVTASNDTTARIWDARVQADPAAQILWDASAETDPLSGVDRTPLGLPPDSRVRAWPTTGSGCDQAAAAIYDPERVAPGALREAIDAEIANAACSAEAAKPEHTARSDYQMGRLLFAKGDADGAARQLELAVAKGYRAARIDLADLLVSVSAKRSDPIRAASLYGRAWQDGVSIAAFDLGHLYEYGLQPADTSGVVFHPDASRAWQWYQKGADAGEPYSLARFAERNEHDALAAADPSRRNAQLLQAFELYAAAAERAHDEAWPDDAWKHWRYRRASLARLLAIEGMMQQVADVYGAVLAQRSAQPAPP
jgi:WD40 repeat protein